MPVLAVVVGLAFGGLFVRRQCQLTSPLLDLRLFSNRAFSAALVSMFGMTAIGANMLFISQYLQLVVGLSPFRAGLWMLPGVLGGMVGLLVSPLIARRVRPAYPIGAGLLVAVAGFIALAEVDATSGLAPVVVGFVLFNVGCSPLVTLGIGLIVGSAAPEKAGSAAAMGETSSEFGFALGIATLGSLAAAVYRGQIANSIPAEVPATAAIVSVVIVLGVALLALTMLRHVRPLGEAQPAPPDAIPAPEPVPAAA